MKFDISSFSEIATPLLNKLAEQFPLPLQINTRRYEILDSDLSAEPLLLKATLHFLVQNNYLSTKSQKAEGVVIDCHLTEKGLALLNLSFETEFKNSLSTSIYNDGKTGC
ncbi:hypothetical protein [Pseudoalteromonas nigrifaciens]|uniref:hypothetical protein n=1 Tax=Pseudoalteromonas nigrifaciens TaxID=28109 RepID=UPI000B796F36|nr:hypothetical protein [Pseudoalteromonas nigrifaciens]GEN40654.1 hypothetical protein PNI02_01200 [Pseudoalteromonas nigrifaciens]SUC52495.1 Uncharacterised protein [Pseudoalteromonas nigrifaciens]